MSNLLTNKNKTIVTTDKINGVVHRPDFSVAFNIEGDSRRFITGSYGPTGNCQTAVIGHFNQILGVEKSKKAILETLVVLYSELKKPMFMFDIHTKLAGKLKRLFDKEDIILESSYVSTNASKMTILLIRTKKLYEMYMENMRLQMTSGAAFADYPTQHIQWIIQERKRKIAEAKQEAEAKALAAQATDSAAAKVKNNKVAI